MRWLADADKVQALLVAWCISEGDEADTVVAKVLAVLHFLGVNLKIELPPSSPPIRIALKDVSPGSGWSR